MVEPAPPNGEDTASELELGGAAAALEYATLVLQEQLRAIEGTDGKIERLFSVAVAAVGLYTTAVAIVAERADGVTLLVAAIFGAVAGLLFFGAAWYLARAYWISEWNFGPGSSFLDIAAEHSDAVTRQWLAQEIYEAHVANSEPFEKKRDLSTRAAIIVTAEAVAVIAGLVSFGFALAAQ